MSLTWFDNFLSAPRRLNTILYVIYSNTVTMSTVKRSSNNSTCRRNPERCEIKKTQSHGCEVKPGLRSPASYRQQNGNKLLFFLYSVNFFLA